MSSKTVLSFIVGTAGSRKTLRHQTRCVQSGIQLSLCTRNFAFAVSIFCRTAQPIQRNRRKMLKKEIYQREISKRRLCLVFNKSCKARYDLKLRKVTLIKRHEPFSQRDATLGSTRKLTFTLTIWEVFEVCLKHLVILYSVLELLTTNDAELVCYYSTATY